VLVAATDGQTRPAEVVRVYETAVDVGYIVEFKDGAPDVVNPVAGWPHRGYRGEGNLRPAGVTD